MVLLSANNILMKFGGLTALNRINFHINKGEIVGLIGPNGAGKTTLFNVITGFARATHGELSFQGRKILGLPPHQIASLGIIRTYQKTSVFSDLSVSQNIAIGNHKNEKAGIISGLFHNKQHLWERKRTHEVVESILHFLELNWCEGYLARNLSYGDLRRLEIGIALAGSPFLLLLDEPAAGLNPEETEKLMGTIEKIRGQGITIFLVEHDMKLVMGICERIIVLNHGMKIAEGSPKEIQEKEEVIKVYLGEDVDDA